jgi:phosphate:Na+ symporter
LNDILFAIAKILGGLGLFIFAMEIMSKALQKAAGEGLRNLLQRVTENRLNGFLTGTGLSFLVHSSAATVMLVGFLSAGLLTFTRSIPIMLGANIGTTLSMQLISFKIGKFCYLAIALGLLLNKLFKREAIVQAGLALFGFGLLFLGMNVMAEAISPLKDAENVELIEHYVQWISASSFVGLLLGILFWSLFTSTIQSSGATLAICFTLCTKQAGQEAIFTSFDDLFPCLLGAHMGTCVTAAFGSLGANFRAKRLALSHFIFNVFSTVLACLLFWVYKATMPMLGVDLVRQAANANTAIQLSAALIILPLSKPYTRFIKRIGPFKREGAEKSFLNQNLINTPEMAILAVIKEIRRVARMTRAMLEASMEALLAIDTSRLNYVRKTEEAVDILKAGVNNYLLRIAERELSRRQTILIQYLGACINDFERAADHIDSFAQLTEDKIKKDIWFDNEDVQKLVVLYKSIDEILKLTVRSLKPLSSKTKSSLDALSNAQELYFEQSSAISNSFQQKIFQKSVDPIVGVYYAKFLTCFDKIVRHSNAVANLKKQPLFYVKEYKLEFKSPKLDHENPLPISDRHPFGDGKTLKELIKELESKSADEKSADEKSADEDLIDEEE